MLRLLPATVAYPATTNNVYETDNLGTGKARRLPDETGCDNAAHASDTSTRREPSSTTEVVWECVTHVGVYLQETQLGIYVYI